MSHKKARERQRKQHEEPLQRGTEDVKCIQSYTDIHTLTQVGDHSLWPVPAELVIVLLQYTELVCVVISETHGSYQTK